MSDFGKTLNFYRASKDMSIRELARRSGHAHSFLSQVETGVRNTPKPATIKDIAKGLGVPSNNLMAAAGYIESEKSEEPQSEVGIFIKRKRKFIRMTLRELADLTKYTNAYLSNIENGKREPSIQSLIKIAPHLKTKRSVLLDKAGYHEVAEAFRCKEQMDEENHQETMKKSGLFMPEGFKRKVKA